MYTVNIVSLLYSFLCGVLYFTYSCSKDLLGLILQSWFIIRSWGWGWGRYVARASMSLYISDIVSEIVLCLKVFHLVNLPKGTYVKPKTGLCRTRQPSLTA